MVSQGGKLSVQLIIVYLHHFLSTFYHLTFINIVQMSLNFQGKISLFKSCVKTIIIEQYLETCHSSKDIILIKLDKNINFLALFPSNFWNPSLNDTKFSEMLLLYEL